MEFRCPKLDITTDHNQRRFWLNPVSMHAFEILEACKDDVSEAIYIAAIQADETNPQYLHWKAVHGVLNQEGAKA
jgi:hypothetical protein